MTIVIHRLHETDPVWWQKFLDEMKADQNTAGATFRGEVLDRAIGIVEHAVKPESTAPTSAAIGDRAPGESTTTWQRPSAFHPGRNGSPQH